MKHFAIQECSPLGPQRVIKEVEMVLYFILPFALPLSKEQAQGKGREAG
jgi:hypothetical protein